MNKYSIFNFISINLQCNTLWYCFSIFNRIIKTFHLPILRTINFKSKWKLGNSVLIRELVFPDTFTWIGLIQVQMLILKEYFIIPPTMILFYKLFIICFMFNYWMKVFKSCHLALREVILYWLNYTVKYNHL